MNKKQKGTLARIIGAFALLLVAVFITGADFFPQREGYNFYKLIVFLPSYLLIGWDILFKAVSGITKGQIFDENFLMSVATVGALVIQEFPEAVAVMLFYQVGELFQSYAVGRSRKSIAELMDIRPDYANIMQDGKMVQVDPEEIAIGDEIIVTAGEKVPLDGIVVNGESSLDTKALTGESVPRTIRLDDEALSGCINLTGVLTIKVTKEFGESTVSKILELVENASSKKAKTENFITRFAKIYTPLVVLAAALLAIVPPLLIPGATFKDYVTRALTFLVISCPCALVISVPLSFFGGLGGASRHGILIKGSNYLEALGSTKIMAFDKTGTLTHGVFEVADISPSEGVEREELLEVVAHIEHYSSHPIALSLQKEYGKEIDISRIKNFENIAGHGVKAEIDGTEVSAGNAKLMQIHNIDFVEPDSIGTVVYVSKGNKFMGHISIEDKIKEDSRIAIEELKQRGIKTVMLTGDSKLVGEKVGYQLGINEVHAELLPADKVTEMETMMSQKGEKEKLAFVGDGINDAPVLAGADIGIAMGGLGSDAAIEAADIVLMDDKLSKIGTAMKIAKKTMVIVRENIAFALGVKAIVLVLGALNLTNMWWAVFADVGVSIIAILNATRALKAGDTKG